jgi:hypothetical protein
VAGLLANDGVGALEPLRPNMAAMMEFRRALDLRLREED